MDKIQSIGTSLIFLFFLLTRVCKADIAIYCPKCHTHLYDYKKDEIPRPINNKSQIYAKDFVPIGEIAKPTEDDDMVCPLDGAPLNGWEYWFWEKGRDLPKMVYPAISLLTKNNDPDVLIICRDYPHKVNELISEDVYLAIGRIFNLKGGDILPSEKNVNDFCDDRKFIWLPDDINIDDN